MIELATTHAVAAWNRLIYVIISGRRRTENVVG